MRAGFWNARCSHGLAFSSQRGRSLKWDLSVRETGGGCSPRRAYSSRVMPSVGRLGLGFDFILFFISPS